MPIVGFAERRGVREIVRCRTLTKVREEAPPGRTLRAVCSARRIVMVYQENSLIRQLRVPSPPGSKKCLAGWIATNQVSRPQDIALKLVEDALHGCSQGVAMQRIERIHGTADRHFLDEPKKTCQIRSHGAWPRGIASCQ